jgi:TatA/E family protein of Tat protein translocase
VLAFIDSDWALIFIVVAVLVLFGGSRLPKLFHSLGSAQAEYKKGLTEGHQAETAAPAAPIGQTAPAPTVTAAPGAVPDSTVQAPGAVAGEPAPVPQPAPVAQPAPPAPPAPGQPQPGA